MNAVHKQTEITLSEMDAHPLDQTGVISSIQRFSIHDGPGIRTTVFLKGCPLRCFWCHNPEAIHPKIEIRYHPDRCIGCGACVEACTQGAHVINTNGHQYLRNLCVQCTDCVEQCYANALEVSGEQKTVQQVMDNILLDLPFYHKDKGGVTLSGGEPLSQRKFSAAILYYCKQQGLHTAVETSAILPWSYFKILMPYTDYWIMDIKHTNSTKHQEATGSPNEQILANAMNLARAQKPLLIHIPVVPTVNDSEKEILEIARFVRSLIDLRKENHPLCDEAQNGISLELLRFHKMAKDKYSSLGIEYGAGDLVPPSKEKMSRLVEIVRSSGVSCFDKWKKKSGSQ